MGNVACARRIRAGAASDKPMLEVEINRVDAEALQAGFACLLHVFRAAVHSRAAVRQPQVSELGRDDIAVALPGDRAPDQLLVGAFAIGVGRVDEIDAQIERPVNRLDCKCRIGIAIDGRHPHAAETDAGHIKGAKLASLHGRIIRVL